MHGVSIAVVLLFTSASLTDLSLPDLTLPVPPPFYITQTRTPACDLQWYQLDGYFNGGTAPWLVGVEGDNRAPTVPCTWSPLRNDTYVAGYPSCGRKSFATADAAKTACSSTHDCQGITYTDGKLDDSGAYACPFLFLATAVVTRTLPHRRSLPGACQMHLCSNMRWGQF